MLVEVGPPGLGSGSARVRRRPASGPAAPACASSGERGQRLVHVADERSLLALRVNGADLSPDHGVPARIIAPPLPGVHCTKWVGRLTAILQVVDVRRADDVLAWFVAGLVLRDLVLLSMDCLVQLQMFACHSGL